MWSEQSRAQPGHCVFVDHDGLKSYKTIPNDPGVHRRPLEVPSVSDEPPKHHEDVSNEDVSKI